MNGIEERVVKLELNHDMLDAQIKELRKEHREQIQAVKNQMRELVDIVENMSITMNSIKWWLIGFISFIVAEQSGILSLIKKVLF